MRERGILSKTCLLSPALSSFLRQEEREKSQWIRTFPDLCRYQWLTPWATLGRASGAGTGPGSLLVDFHFPSHPLSNPSASSGMSPLTKRGFAEQRPAGPSCSPGRYPPASR